ncbi:hypothetical protein [Clostridium sp. UBA4395]|uniref:hypothetical protein n=1 Tax=Clostridium sp. UBA4395 TaxID=1946360 RepID=UPI003216917C
MNKEQVLILLQLTDKQLDWLEDDYLRIHKEYIQRVTKNNKYEEWYIKALIEWKSKREKYIPPTY